MPRSTRSRRGKSSSSSNNNDNDEANNNNDEAAPAAAAAGAPARQLPAHVRARQRAVAEREAARLARPEKRPVAKLGHADRKKSAVTSPPFGILNSSRNNQAGAAEETSTTWCGPFTVARQMIAARDQAKRQREEEQEELNNDPSIMNHPLDAAMEEIEHEKRVKAHPSLLWKSCCVTPDSKSAKNDNSRRSSKKARLPSRVELTQNKIPSLYQLCVNFVVNNFEHVESLGQVDHSIRTSIAHALAGKNALNGTALAALCERDMEALELIDCADVPQEAICEALRNAPTSLRYLILDQAGRCFGNSTAETLLNPFHKHATNWKPMPMFALHVGGAYLLKDDDAAKLIQAMAPTLQSLAWKACPLLGLEMCKSIPSQYNNPKHTLLEFSLEDMSLSKDCWDALLGNIHDKNNDKKKDGDHKWQCNLKSLTLRRVGLQDDMAIALLQHAPHLEHVDLSDNHELTDACLSPLRAHPTSSLRSLALYNLKQLTSIGLETLFTHGLDGMGPPPQLKRLNLNHLDVGAVTDQVMELVLQSASQKPAAATMDASAATVASTVGCLSLLGGMVRLELQGSAITDSTLEQIAATSANTLEYLNVSFCPEIGDKGLGYLVDTVGNQLETIEIWGNAQITEEFWNGHSRVFEGGSRGNGGGSNAPVVVPLQVTGAWMKKSGVSSIRS